MRNRYEVSFANYPTDFEECVISATKICLHFTEPQIKMRPHETNLELYPKGIPEEGIGDYPYIPVFTTGTNLKGLFVGCQMPVVEKYQLALIDAYKIYYNRHKTTYNETYGKDFKEFLKQLQIKINDLLENLP